MKKQTNTVAIERITPERARALLDQFPINRRVNERRVESYRMDMERGFWSPHAMIIIDEKGLTRDGYHRLSAVVESGKTIDMVVFRGLEEKYLTTIDTGRPRSAGDMLAFVEGLEGMTCLRNIAALGKAILYYKTQETSRVISSDSLATFILDNRRKIEKAYQDYCKIKPIGGIVAHGAAMYVIREANPGFEEKVDEFIEQIAYGENISSGMPSYAVRNAIFTAKGKAYGGEAWAKSFYMILKGWRSFVVGEKVKQMKLFSATLENILKIDIRIDGVLQADDCRK